VSRARLFLAGIRALGRHGARPGEKDQAQTFVVDLDLEVEVGDDAIEGTADYRTITETARSVVEEGSFDLIESLAAEIASRVVALPRVARATAVVHKPNAASRLEIDGVAAAASAEGDA
jgi:dihydroneopterin aldolase